MQRTYWYKDKVFYQIWPRSFKDGNGDGIGDLLGVYDKLEYIKSLGVDGIWFSPLYVSPGVDCGYDIADYYHIDPVFGGDEAFFRVLKKAHELDLKVIMDLVVNHTSTECEWFKKSRERIEPYTDYYIWRPAKKNGKLPNNWDSEFEGDSAWEWDDVRKEYYLHIFAISQADLNMDNPLVREEVKKILKYWLDMGVDGFREDVITYISKPEGLPSDHLFPVHKGLPLYNLGPHLHEYLEEFKEDVLSNYDYVTLAEATLIKPKKALSLIGEGPQNVIDMVIQFECECADCFLSDYYPIPFSLRKMKRAFRTWQEKLYNKAWNMLYIENHDHPRIVSRYGSEAFQKESAKMLAGMYMFLQGTPFIYQGQEIGMTNFRPSSSDMYEDVQTRNYKVRGSEEKRLKLLHRASRDSARTPMQWSKEENAGFTTGKPWFYVNENYKNINVEDQLNDEASVLNFYKKVIALRKALPVVKDGKYTEYKKLSNSFYFYKRENDREILLVLCSFRGKNKSFSFNKYDLKKAKLILSNYCDNLDMILKPYEIRVYHIDK